MRIKSLISVLLLAFLLYGCGAAGEGGVPGAKQPVANKNPKDAAVKIESGVVSITMPSKTSYFFFEKVQDDSVSYSNLYFRRDSADGKYYYQTNLETWKPVELTDNAASMGLMKLTFAETGITVTYPSGSWRFP